MKKCCSKKQQIEILLKTNNDLLEEIRQLNKKVKFLEQKEEIYNSRDVVISQFFNCLKPLVENWN